MIALVALAAAQAAEPVPLPEPNPLRRPPAQRFATHGFRAAMPAKDHLVATRGAFVQDFDGATIGEVTLRGQVAWQSFSLAVETAATAGASPRWSSAGLGNTQ